LPFGGAVFLDAAVLLDAGFLEAGFLEAAGFFADDVRADVFAIANRYSV
jgi:hypothetical protein